MVSSTISHYRITAKLGQGGMGEVYRATDTKLDREVAIKVLPKSFAEDATRLARFEREAKVLAALNHPNIAIIYGIEQSVEAQALIMELVEGETLGERLRREPMTVSEALDCCKQIAEALEAAHDKGIIHRDLKPENVKITPEGRVKVLDFGLAKEVVDPASSTIQGDSPTITHLTTLRGELLGTAPYMSPEQARARPVDKRSDIWSFGCVLYECLTGKPMFGGEDVTETLASIIKGEPDWDALPEDTPPTIELLLRKCLNKDRKRRLHDIADARIDIEQALGDPSSSIMRLSDRALLETTKRAGINAFLTIGAVVLVALVCIVLTWFLKPQPPARPALPRPVRRISMNLGMESRLRLTNGSAVQFSPDGSRLAFMAAADDGSGRTQLYLRRLDQLQATPVPAAKAVDEFCFSPDGQWLAFRDYEQKSLKKAELTGGAATPLCGAEGAYGIDWSEDGWIAFAEATGGLLRVSDNGGTPEPLTTLTGDDRTHRWPQVLPGGKSILFTAHVAQGGFGGAKIMFQRLPDGEPELVADRGSYPQYLSSGHVVFLRGLIGSRLFGVPFDPNAGPNGAEPVPLDGTLDGTVFPSLPGAGHFDVSADGTLVYCRLPDVSYNLAWVDRAGAHETVREGDNFIAFYSFDLSPDGRSLVYNSFAPGRFDLWVYDITQVGVPSRLTFGSSGGLFPLWSPGGKCIVYAGSGSALYWKLADGSGEIHKLCDSDSPTFPRAWHPGGSPLVLYKETQNGASDLVLLELKGDDQSGWQAGQIKDFHPTPYKELNASFSPDGKWLAYDSDESGRRQVYVLPFPDLQGPKQILFPDHDAYNPVWSSTTNELCMMAGNSADEQGQVYVVHYSVEGGLFVPEEPVPWPSGVSASANPDLGGYDFDPDGARLLVRTPADDEMVARSRNRLVLVEGFSDELRKQLPAGGRQP